MTDCRTIINRALRKLGRLGGGREPRTADQADALAALQGLYSSWIASGAFGRLYDVVLSQDYTTQGNERIFRPEGVTANVILPVTVDRYAVLYGTDLFLSYYGIGAGNGDYVQDDYGFPILTGPNNVSQTTPRDGWIVQISDELTGNLLTYIYDGTLKLWQQIESLQPDDEAPRSVTDPEGLSACLALELVDTFGADVGAATTRQALRFQTTLSSRFSMPRQQAIGVYM